MRSTKGVKITPPANDLYEEAMEKHAVTQAEINQANIDYLAMMTDVDIPTEDDQEVPHEL